VVRASLVAEEPPGKQHVVGDDRLSIRKPRTRIEIEGDEAPRVVGLDLFGKQAVKREGLVLPAREQQSPEALGALQQAETAKWAPIIKAADIKPG